MVKNAPAISIEGVMGRLSMKSFLYPDRCWSAPDVQEPYRRAYMELKQQWMEAFIGLRPLTGKPVTRALESLGLNGDQRLPVYRDEEGEIFILANHQEDPRARIARSKGCDRVRSALAKRNLPKLGFPKFPEHMRNILRNMAVAPEAAEHLVNILGEFSVTGRQGGMTFKVRQSEMRGDERRRTTTAEWQERVNERTYEALKIQVSRKPEISVTRTGITIKQELPVSVTSQLAGKPLSAFMEIPGVDDCLVSSVINRGETTTIKTDFKRT